MASIDQVLAEFRAAVAAVATSRDATKNFLEHKTNDPFEDSSIAGADGFALSVLDLGSTSSFGLDRTAEMEARIVLMLGHAPYKIDSRREELLARDVERLTDVFEHRAWTTPGIVACFYEPPYQSDKARANWWLTGLTFRVLYTRTIGA